MITSELSSWMPAIALRCRAPQLPCQTPLVSGWTGSTERAHWNTCGSKRRDEVELVRALHLAVHLRRVVGFIPQVPAQNAIVVAEQAHHSGDVVVQDAS